MSFEPENALEKAMALAAAQESARPAFFRSMMEAELFLLGEADIENSGRLSIDTITRGAETYHPVFTSERRLREFVRGPAQGFTMGGRVLFLATRGAAFVINPGSELNKILLPQEIAYWLDQAAPSPSITVIPPPKHPKKLIQALSVLFTSRSRVTSARLIYAAQEGLKPYPLIGIEAEGDARLLSKEIFEAAAAAMPRTRIDVIHLNAPGLKHPLQEHLLAIAPFYERKTPIN
ncbi:MAG: enhanced serine sensitivity protein SseB C-terminal domain-containing protein [Alphaproteobacteria bacterium]|nr:enhanced serine sensitivity protein SseB C-terminal domain-containing protein [Alphaproteobacteria bacterium]